MLHHALCSHNDWDWYRDLVGARYQVEAQPGRPASSYNHDETIPVAVARPHPITPGVSLTEIHDETYKGMWIAPANTVLLTTTHALADPPLAWISGYPQSRVVAIQPGHGREAHVHPGYRALVRNAIAWAGGRLAGAGRERSGSTRTPQTRPLRPRSSPSACGRAPGASVTAWTLTLPVSTHTMPGHSSSP